MRKLSVLLAIVACLLFAAPQYASASTASNPVFASAKVNVLTTDGAKHVTAKGALANYYGSLALNNLYYAYLYQYYAYYYNGSYGYYATQYALNGAAYAYTAYVMWSYGY